MNKYQHIHALNSYTLNQSLNFADPYHYLFLLGMVIGSYKLINSKLFISSVLVSSAAILLIQHIANIVTNTKNYQSIDKNKKTILGNLPPDPDNNQKPLLIIDQEQHDHDLLQLVDSGLQDSYFNSNLDDEIAIKFQDHLLKLDNLSLDVDSLIYFFNHNNVDNDFILKDFLIQLDYIMDSSLEIIDLIFDHQNPLLKDYFFSKGVDIAMIKSYLINTMENLQNTVIRSLMEEQNKDLILKQLKKFILIHYKLVESVKTDLSQFLLNVVTKLNTPNLNSILQSDNDMGQKSPRPDTLVSFHKYQFLNDALKNQVLEDLSSIDVEKIITQLANIDNGNTDKSVIKKIKDSMFLRYEYSMYLTILFFDILSKKHSSLKELSLIDLSQLQKKIISQIEFSYFNIKQGLEDDIIDLDVISNNLQSFKEFHILLLNFLTKSTVNDFSSYTKKLIGFNFDGK